MTENRSIAVASRLALGTVQFGLDYGISNSIGKTPVEEVAAILRTAASRGVSMLDTAFAYGRSEAVLGESPMVSEFQIVTKFPRPESGSTVEDYLQKSLEILRRGFVYGYLAHDADSLIDNPSLWDQLAILKNEGRIVKRGYSLYRPGQLEMLLRMGLIPDIVQLPYNVFDKRFEPYFEKLKNLGAEIHVRSAFLQGLFFMAPKKLPIHFNKVSGSLVQLHNQFPDKAELAAALLHFCLDNEYIDRVVIGVNTADQLNTNLTALEQYTGGEAWENFNITDESILLPFNWPK